MADLHFQSSAIDLVHVAGNAKPTGRTGLRRCRRGIKRLARLKAGDQVKLRLKRDERELDVTITAGTRPTGVCIKSGVFESDFLHFVEGAKGEIVGFRWRTYNVEKANPR